MKFIIGTAAVCMAAGVLSGCGTTASDQGATQDGRFDGPPELRCLRAAGARQAASHQDLHFFEKAVAAQNAEKTGSVFAHRYRIDVQLWRSVDTQRGRPTWVLWSAQPLRSGRAPGPQAVVAKHDSRHYVAFMIHPTRDQLAHANQCLERVAKGRP